MAVLGDGPCDATWAEAPVRGEKEVRFASRSRSARQAVSGAEPEPLAASPAPSDPFRSATASCRESPVLADVAGYSTQPHPPAILRS